jgi:raffinose/stachyose/melibiose transport system permease protein
MMLERTRKRTYKDYAALFLLLLLLVVMIFPLFIVMLNAFKTAPDYASYGPMALPKHLTLDGIMGFWQRVHFTSKLLNSLVISLSVAVLGTVFSLLNAFALGIGRVKGRLVFLVLFIMANTLPHEGLVYPLYYMAKATGLYNSQASVILIFMVIQGAFGTFLLTSVFNTFPFELIEAALVDGCGKMKLLIQVVAPVSMPTLKGLFTFFFIWTWNEFFLPLIMLISDLRQTVPIAISTLQGQHNMDATTASASALLGVLPCILFFALFQRTLTRGITAGSIK